MKVFVFRHLQVLFDTIGRLSKAPLATLMTISVLGVAIALPLMLFKFSESLNSVTGQWQGNSQLTIFVKLPDGISSDDHQQINEITISFGQGLFAISSVHDIEYMSPDQAMEDFQSWSGFGDVLESLPENPLPPVVIVYPEPSLTTEEISKLATQLSAMPEVDSISYDQAWLQRLSAIIDLFVQGVLVFTVLMSLGVILIISNTVRLEIINRASEIEIVEQIGGTNSFIRRPFLYYGVVQGLAGGLLAMLIANAAIFVINKPVEKLANLYQSELRIEWIDFDLTWIVILSASVLGWFAARMTSGSYLRKLRSKKFKR